MLKQTMLTFKGALGYITGTKREEFNDSDSGDSSQSQQSDEQAESIKDQYTTTGILAPAGQSLCEITVTRLTYKQINAEIAEYYRQSKDKIRYCRVFDSKALVKKSDALSEMMTKVPPKDVQNLAGKAK